jgi:hypothetical protein
MSSWPGGNGWSLRLARVRGDMLSVLEADGVIGWLGSERLHSNVDEAVRAELNARQASGDESAGRR